MIVAFGSVFPFLEFSFFFLSFYFIKLVNISGRGFLSKQPCDQTY